MPHRVPNTYTYAGPYTYYTNSAGVPSIYRIHFRPPIPSGSMRYLSCPATFRKIKYYSGYCPCTGYETIPLIAGVIIAGFAALISGPHLPLPKMPFIGKVIFLTGMAITASSPLVYIYRVYHKFMRFSWASPPYSDDEGEW